MAPIAIIFGILLTILGIVLYAMSSAPTALIPSGLGLVLVLLGQIARGGSEKVRMHTMHAAALIGLIGLVGGIVRIAVAVPRIGTDNPPSNLALGGNIAMAALCAVFLVLCVKSFIDARRARKKGATTSEPQA